MPRVGLQASRAVPEASLKAATGQGRRLFIDSCKKNQTTKAQRMHKYA